jgi:hypothetical protein
MDFLLTEVLSELSFGRFSLSWHLEMSIELVSLFDTVSELGRSSFVSNKLNSHFSSELVNVKLDILRKLRFKSSDSSPTF